MKSVKVFIAIAVVGLLALAMGHSAIAADKFPTKPITLIVPWSPGGSGDMTCRILASHMETVLGQPVVVKNMPGAGSMVGAKALADSAPDGYTLGFLGISATIGQYTSVSPVMLDQYEPVSGIINPPLVLFVNSSSPFKTLKDFVDYGKANPGKLKNGNAGAGVIDHLYSSEFGRVAGIQFTQVPYKGWGPALTELAGGHVDCMFVAIGPAKPLMQAGKIRPLAIAAEKRYPSYPDIPTMKEGGVDVTMPFWESIVVPKGTPESIIAILDNSIKKSFEDPGISKKIKDSGLDVEYMDTAGITNLRQESDKRVKGLVEALGLKQGK